MKRSPEINGDISHRLFIDADGFPNIELALDISSGYGFSSIIVGNYAQNLSRFEEMEGVEIKCVDEGPDAADFAIMTAIRAGDLLLTGDSGLAAVVLDKGAKVLGPRGYEYNSETIDYRLARRHESKKARRGGARGRGPRKLGDDDLKRFEERLRGFFESRGAP